MPKVLISDQMDPKAAEVFRVKLEGGAAEPVSRQITALTSGWQLVDGGIWYIADIEVDSASLHALDPASGEDRVISRFDAILRDLAFSVMPDRGSIIAVPFLSEDTDVGLFRLERADMR